jgi:hypothetical protein
MDGDKRETTDLDDCRIFLGPLGELVKGELGVLVLVHVAEDLVHTLYGTNDPVKRKEQGSNQGRMSAQVIGKGGEERGDNEGAGGDRRNEPSRVCPHPRAA